MEKFYTVASSENTELCRTDQKAEIMIKVQMEENTDFIYIYTVHAECSSVTLQDLAASVLVEWASRTERTLQNNAYLKAGSPGTI